MCPFFYQMALLARHFARLNQLSHPSGGGAGGNANRVTVAGHETDGHHRQTFLYIQQD